MPVTIEYRNGDSYTAIVLDVTEHESYEATAALSDHPVERGVNISDHVRANPDTITLEAMISNTPIVSPADQPSGSVRPATITVGGVPVRVNTLQWATPFDRARSADTLFNALLHDGALLRVTTGLRTMESMVLTRYSADRTAATGSSLPVVLEFRQARQVSTLRTNVATPAQRRGQRAGNRGGQPASTTPSGQNTARRQSAAQSILNRLRGV